MEEPTDIPGFAQPVAVTLPESPQRIPDQDEPTAIIARLMNAEASPSAVTRDCPLKCPRTTLIERRSTR